mgnify:FL=1
MNEIQIYDVIGQDMFGEGVTAKGIKAELDAIESGDLTVRINSAGGDVFEGLAIFNLLKEFDGKVTVKVDGYAASIASVIAMAGDEVIMGQGAMFMLHNPYTFSMGDAEELRAQALVLDEVRDSLISTYKTRVSASEDELKTILDAETWFGADESKAFGLADSLSSEKAKVMNLSGCRWINKAPEIVEDDGEDFGALVKPEPAYLDYLEQSNRIAQERADLSATRKNLKG